MRFNAFFNGGTKKTNAGREEVQAGCERERGGRGERVIDEQAARLHLFGNIIAQMY